MKTKKSKLILNILTILWVIGILSVSTAVAITPVLVEGFEDYNETGTYPDNIWDLPDNGWEYTNDTNNFSLDKGADWPV